MTFVVTRTSTEFPTIKTFNTLQELIDFSNSVGEELIIKSNFWYHEPITRVIDCGIPKDLASKIVTIENEIEIYDDYRE